jgi:hypothetical protein
LSLIVWACLLDEIAGEFGRVACPVPESAAHAMRRDSPAHPAKEHDHSHVGMHSASHREDLTQIA